MQHTASTPRWVWVQRLLFLVVAALGSAIFAVFMPAEWMRYIAERLGVGPLPQNGLVHYLARQTSALYVLHAGTLAVMAFYMPRALPMVVPLGYVTIGFAGVVLAIDLLEQMPWWWVCIEPFNISLGGLSLILAGHWASKDSSNAHSST